MVPSAVSSGVSLIWVTAIAVSVGPYRFQTSIPGAAVHTACDVGQGRGLAAEGDDPQGAVG